MVYSNKSIDGKNSIRESEENTHIQKKDTEEYIKLSTKVGVENCINGLNHDNVVLKEAIEAKDYFDNFNYSIEDEYYSRDIPRYILELPQVQECVKKAFIKNYESDFLGFRIKLIHEFLYKYFTEDTIKSSEIQKCLQDIFIDFLLNKTRFDEHIAKYISKDFFETEEYQQSVLNYCIEELKSTYSDFFIEEYTILNKYHLSDQKYEKFLIALFKKTIFVNFKTTRTIPESMFHSQEFQEIVKEKILEYFNGGYDFFHNLKHEDFLKRFPQIFLSQKCFSDTFKSVFIKKLQNGEGISQNYYKDIKQWQGMFYMEDFFLSEEVKEAAKQGYSLQIFEGKISFLKSYKDLFHISDEFFESDEIRNNAKKGAIELLQKGGLFWVKNLLKEKYITEDFIKTQEVQEAIIVGILSGRSKITSLDSILEASQLSTDATIQDERVQGVIFKYAARELSSNGDFDYRLKNITTELKEKLYISDKKIAKIVSEEIASWSKKNVYDNRMKTHNRLTYIKSIKDYQILSDETFLTERFQKLFREYILYFYIDESREYPELETLKEIEKLLTNYNILEDPIAQEMITKKFLQTLKFRYGYESLDFSMSRVIKKILNEEHRYNPIFQEYAKKQVSNLVSKKFEEKDLFLELKETFFGSELFQDIGVEFLINYAKNGEYDRIDYIKNMFDFSEEDYKGLVENFCIKEYINAGMEASEQISNNLGISLSEKEIMSKLPEFILQEGNISRIKNTSHSKEILDRYILGDSWDYSSEFSPLEATFIKKIKAEENNISIEEILQYEIDGIKSEEEYKQLFDFIKITNSEWTEAGGMLVEKFELGAEYFGYKQMFQYVGNEKRHDKLFAFDQIARLAQKSELAPNDFFSRILMQVAYDGATYEGEIDSYGKLNNVSRFVNQTDIEEKLAEGRKYNIQKLQVMLDGIESARDIFQSWKYLKKFVDLAKALEKRHIWEKIEKLEGKQKEWSHTMLTHENIDTYSVMDFLEKPKEFLSRDDEHSSDLHYQLKPSNYTDKPFMHLTSEELRDALIEGSLDSIQGWEPLDIIYQVPRKEVYLNTSLSELLQEAIGQERKGIKGNAQNVGKLFKELKDYAKENNFDIFSLIRGEIGLSYTQVQEVLAYVYGKNGLPMVFDEYRARITLKSDPMGSIAGDDTACCMSFGSGKNNVYMYNPTVGQFIVQKKSLDDWKTVAQSVLTKNINIQKTPREFMNFSPKDFPFSLLSNKILEGNNMLMTCDNIEIGKNFKNKELLKNIYSDFFYKYAEKFAKEQNLSSENILIGLAYSDTTFGDTIKNTYLPVVPVAYSDNSENSVYSLSLKETQSMQRSLVHVEERNKREKLRDLTKGVQELGMNDILAVSKIEENAYGSNLNLREGLFEMENTIIAQSINNTHKNFPNLSFSYRDLNGKMQGYMIAYQGIDDYNQNAIYIADLAANPDSRMAGGKLIHTFMEQYKKKYLDNYIYYPIYLEARDQTSYNIIMNQIEKFGENLGIGFKIEEMGGYKSGGDTMHKLKIIPTASLDYTKKDDGELNEDDKAINMMTEAQMRKYGL